MKYLILLCTTFLFWNALGYASPLKENSNETKEAVVSSDTVISNSSVANSILSYLQTNSQTRSRLRAKTAVSYSTSNSSFKNKFFTYTLPIVLDAIDTSCVTAKGTSAFVDIDYVSKDQQSFLDQKEISKSHKKDAIGWVPGDLKPSDIYTLIWVGAPIPRHFSSAKVQIVPSTRFLNQVEVTIPFQENSIQKKEVLLMDPKEKVILQADLYEVSPHVRHVWHLENEGFLRVANSPRMLPSKVKLDFSFLTGTGDTKYRKIEISFEKAEILDTEPERCRSLIFANAGSPDQKDQTDPHSL